VINQMTRISVSGKFFSTEGRKFFVKGVTYGPFAPNAEGDFFTSPEVTRRDFARIRHDLGANLIRTYYAPPRWLLEEAEAADLRVLVDIPWSKHLCFLEDAQASRQARQAIRSAVRRGGGSPAVLGFSVGNEISPNIVRWYGARPVERFLTDLAAVARDENSEALVTYANYPSTEFLDTSAFADFETFNVYLQDEAAFRRYLLRLQNRVGDKPLILGEFGLDTLRNGEQAQSDILAWHLRAVQEAGLAGTTVYAWTDDWFTGGHQIEDWAFGITRRDRSPKLAYDIVKEGFARTPRQLLGNDAPRVSVVVCSYNGGRTLAQCLESLRCLDYPDYEVILVDDGSTDNTRAIAARFPEVKAIHQENYGLSHARNVGIRNATGEIVAYTDSDCFADQDWLTYLVLKLRQTGATGAGGPNLTPDDGPLASWVSVAPGQPTHVLLSDRTAEHIPGCNMAFWKSALEAINGFDPDYRTAGDDVDLCWRLQHAGHRIVFAPAAMVWHHRRQDMHTFLKQQKGYGHAEGILKFKHPDRFNERGDSRWHGSIYGVSAWGLRIGRPIIYHGIFGAGLFQTLYTRGPAHWPMIPGCLEWITAAALILALAPFAPVFGIVSLGMLACTLALAVTQAFQARVPLRYDGLTARAVMAYLCLAQPLVRSMARYLYQLRGKPGTTAPSEAIAAESTRRLPFIYHHESAYWAEGWQERTTLVSQFARLLNTCNFAFVLDTGWTDWDVEVAIGPWAKVRIKTVEEDHGGGHRLVRVRYQLLPTLFTRSWLLLLFLAVALLVTHNPFPAAALCALVVGVLGMVWQRAARRARSIIHIFDDTAQDLGYWRRPWRDRWRSGYQHHPASSNGRRKIHLVP
jgi:GT2 family glycosyltransferase